MPTVGGGSAETSRLPADGSAETSRRSAVGSAKTSRRLAAASGGSRQYQDGNLAAFGRLSAGG